MIFQAQHRQSGLLAAAKMCRLDGEDDLADFMIEIDILTEIKHPNIVELLEAFQKEQQVKFVPKTMNSVPKFTVYSSYGY